MQLSNTGQYTRTSTRMPGSYLENTYGRASRTGNAQQKSEKPATSNSLIKALFDASSGEFPLPVKQTIITKGDFLFQQDDEVEYIYFPETAVISEFRLLEDGRMVEIAITGREGALGIPSLFGPCLAANCAEVSHTGTALKIETSLIKKHIAANPSLMLLMYEHLNHYIRQISQKAICNMYHSVEKRFCTWLLMLQDRTQRDLLKLTHEEIARILGVYRPSVTYIALDLRKNGIIDYSRGGISIRDREKLEGLACDCYAELIADTVGSVLPPTSKSYSRAV